MTRVGSARISALVLVVLAFALAVVVAVGLAVQGEDDLGSARWVYVPVIMLGPVMAVTAVAAGYRRNVVWLAAGLCWLSVVPTMPFFLYGLTLIVSAGLLTLVAAMPPDRKRPHHR